MDETGSRNESKLKNYIVKYKKQIITATALLILVVAVFVFMKNNYSLYKDTIGTVVKVNTQYTTDEEGPNKEVDKQYTQTLTIMIHNGDYEGKYIEITNRYSETQMKNTRYSKGDDVFITIEDKDGVLTGAIRDVKRDQYVVVMALIFIILLIAISGKQGVLTILSLVVNIGIFLLFMRKYIEGESFEILTIAMVLSFSILTLFILGGINRKSIGAVISSLVTVGLITIIYQLVYRFVEKPPYEMLDYVVGHDDFKGIFTGSVIIGSLGAIMDVAITMNSSICELIDTTPKITVKDLVRSAREIGYDIMGTMVNVLFFTYISGSLPMTILKFKNGYGLLAMIRYNVFFEAARFLLGSIGIVLAIPVSTVVALLIFRRKRRQVEKSLPTHEN